MPQAVTIRVYDNENTTVPIAIAIRGDQSAAGSDVTVASVAVTVGTTTVVYLRSVTSTLTLPAAYLDQSHGPADIRLQPGPLPLALTAPLSPPTSGATAEFFGLIFASTAPQGGLSLELSLMLPGSAAGVAAPENPAVVLSCCGRVQLAALVAEAAIGFRVVFDTLPQTFPSTSAPALEIGLPEIFPWPDARIPWPDFPRIPGLTVSPIRLPTRTFDLAPLPLRIGWKAIEIAPVPSDSGILVTIRDLTVSGLHSEFTGTIVFKLKTDAIRIDSVSFPTLGTISAPVFKSFDPGRFGFDWNGSPLTPLLKLFSAEIDDAAAAASNSLSLRIRASRAGLEEIRLDWGMAAGNRDLEVPGFNVTFPNSRLFSLIARRDLETDAYRLTLVSTFDPGVIHANSTFCWPLSTEQREILKDGKGAGSGSFVSLAVTALQRLSVVICDLPLGNAGKPRFLQRLSEPLIPFTASEAEPGDDGDVVSISNSDSSLELLPLTREVVSLDLSFGASGGSPFTLPFLNSTNDQQLIQVVAGTKTIDPQTLAISCVLKIKITLGSEFVETETTVRFNPERMAFSIDHDQGLWLSLSSEKPMTFLGLNWTFVPSKTEQIITGSITPDNLNGTRVSNAMFVLTTKDGNYALRQAPGSEIRVAYKRATMGDKGIVFRISDFGLGPKGLDVTAEITDEPAKFNGLETEFRFTHGVLIVHENRVAGFTIEGTGPLPPALVGDSVADIALQFAQQTDTANPDSPGSVKLVRGSAHINGSNLLRCSSTRFNFSLDGLGLEFVDDGNGDHLYFTLSGRASYGPAPGDDPSGPLAWLPKLELQLVDCPLTGNMRIIAQHVKFLIDLPEPLKFDLIGCFGMEIRGIGFLPQFDKFLDENGNPTSAMQLAGQVFFAEGAGDVLQTKVDFHNLHVALPEKGSFVPRLYMKGLSIQVKQGESFELCGELEFFNNEAIDRTPDGKEILGDGFAGSGAIQIKGLPRMSATFAFLRVSADNKQTWKRAWFLYLEATQLSIKIPVVEVYLREIGLGFGYRYTLASIRTADEINDPRLLLKELKKLALTQGNLSQRSSWRVDLENPGEDPRWTVACRAMISQTSGQPGPFGDYSAEKEKDLNCLFLLDVVIALRSDLTFFMAGRAWVNTNYPDFETANKRDPKSLANNALFNAFVLLSPRQSRLLANLSSNPNSISGDHPPLPDYVKTAFRDSRFTATLLMEPGLLHLELGWPNQLQWSHNYGALLVDCRGGLILRSSRTELVYGNSFLARGSLAFSAGFDAGFVGASVSASASVAFGARMIGVLDYRDPLRNSAVYGALGIEIRVDVSIAFWLRFEIDLAFDTITVQYDYSFDFSLSFTAAVETGVLLDSIPNIPAMSGHATLSLDIMGHGVHFDIRVETQKDKLQKAIDITSRFMNVGLEAEEVEPVPGVPMRSSALLSPAPDIAPPLAAAALVAEGDGEGEGAPEGPEGSTLDAPVDEPAADLAAAATATVTDSQILDLAMAEGPKPPTGYSLMRVNAPTDSRVAYFLLIPAPPTPQHPASRFYPVPPTAAIGGLPNGVPGGPVSSPITADLQWTFPSPPAGVTFEHFDFIRSETAFSPVSASPYSWRIAWQDLIAYTPKPGDIFRPAFLRNLLLGAYLRPINSTGLDPELGDPTPPTAPTTLDDERVRNPSDAVYESAVRGAFDQIAAPYFKFDDQCEYDRQLREACQDHTTIYSVTGSHLGLSTNDAKAVEKIKQAIQFRGVTYHSMLRDVQRYAALEGRNDQAALDERQKLRSKSLAFRLGMVFRATGTADQLEWLTGGGAAGNFITQRRNRTDTAPDGATQIPVTVFNTVDKSFPRQPPSFHKIRRYEHANTIAVAWELRWDIGGEGPEHHLCHYKVRRTHLDGQDPEIEFPLKKGSVLCRTGPENHEVTQLLARFPLVDHFEAENSADVSALTSVGKTYLYTIVPVDIAGNESPRPLTVVACRFPADPPLVPGDGELIVEYEFNDDPEQWDDPLSTAAPKIHRFNTVGQQKQFRVFFQWSEPVAPPEMTSPPIDKYCLVFRKETAMPVGFYGSDEDSRGGRFAGVPVTNSRTLRTDVTLAPFDVSQAEQTVPDPVTGLPLRSEQGRYVHSIELKVQELKDREVLPPDGLWRPEAWRVFVQTVSSPRGDSQPGVPSALAAVSIRLRFRAAVPSAAPANPADPQKLLPPRRLLMPFEERNAGLLEWLPDPVRFDLHPPEDQSVDSGYAQVPLPNLADPALWIYPLTGDVGDDPPGLKYEAHPDEIRALRITWNQGPSDATNYPLDLHARYQLFEFDANAKTGEALEFEGLLEFGEWSRKADLKLVQEAELLPSEDLPLVPSDTATPSAWEVWTPATSRRVILRRQMIAKRTWPATTDRTRLGPWYSWRESYLRWPETELRTPDNKYALVDVDPEPDVSLLLHDFPSKLAAAPTNVKLTVHSQDYDLKMAAHHNIADLVDAINRTGARVWAQLVPSAGGVQIRLGTPPTVDPQTGRTTDLHPLLYSVVRAIGDQPEAPGNPASQPKYHVEFAAPPPRGDNRPKLPPPPGQPVRPEDPSALGGGVKSNEFPEAAKPGGIVEFVAANSAAADPHGWSILERMGLSIGFRVRVRRSGEIVTGKGLADLVQQHLKKLFELHDYPAFQNFKPYLHVEFLFQPGDHTELGPNRRSTNPEPPRYSSLLALARLTLRPTVVQRLKYLLAGIDAGSPSTLVAGEHIRFKIESTSDEVEYLLQTGDIGVPNKLVFPADAAEFDCVIPPSGKLRVLVRAPMDVNPTFSAIRVSNNSSVAVTQQPLQPTDWESISMVPSVDAPWSSKTDNFLGDGGQTPKRAWEIFKLYVKKIQAGVPVPDADPVAMPLVLSWLNRFFNEGGDIDPVPAIAHTGPGPWVTSAYPRSSTPVALTPDDAGRIKYYHLIQDRWRHVHRYYIRPQGRYDLIWATINRSARIFQQAFGIVDRQQRKIAPPKPGGLDIVLDRTKPVAAPCVLSSQRLDRPTPPGQTVPPGAIWEVIVARHPEQELIDKNRALESRIGFCRVSHTLLRAFAFSDTVAEFKLMGRGVASSAFSSATAAVPVPYRLEVDANSQTFSLTTATLTGLQDKVNEVATAQGFNIAASILPCGTSGLLFRLVIVQNNTTRIGKLRLFTTAGGDSPFVSELLDLDDNRFELPINSTPVSLPSHITPPGTPSLPARLEHLDLTALDEDEALSIDLPLRMSRFTQGVTALQWRALPYYYVHRLLLVAQASAEVSPITALDHRDFSYISPLLQAPGRQPLMEGDAADATRRRKITIPLARYWDCLPEEAQRRWNIENPDMVENGQPSLKRRYSSLPDKDVIYQIIVSRPSGNVEVLAEFRYLKPNQITDVSYESRDLPGPYKGDVIRLLPPLDENGVGRGAIRLEAVLRRVPAAEPTEIKFEPVSSGAAFAGAAAAGVAIRLAVDRISACAVRLTGPITQVIRDEINRIIAFTDVSLGQALRELLSVPRPALQVVAWGDGSGVSTSGNNQFLVGTDSNSRLHIRIFDPSGNLVTDTDETQLPAGRAAAIAALKLLLPGLLPPHVLTSSEIDQVVSQATAIVGQVAGFERYAEACIGLDQLRELNPQSTVNNAAQTLTWIGPISVGQKDRIEQWATTTLFEKTLRALLAAEQTFTYPADAANPVQTDTTIAATRFEITPTGFTWKALLTDAPLPAEITELIALRDKVDGNGALEYPQPVRDSLDDLLAILQNANQRQTVIALDVVEPAWRPRPTQATLAAVLQPVLMVGNAVITFQGMMTLAEGDKLLRLAGLTAPDQLAVLRLYFASLNSGLGGGKLKVRTRRGSAIPVDAEIVCSLSMPH